MHQSRYSTGKCEHLRGMRRSARVIYQRIED